MAVRPVPTGAGARRLRACAIALALTLLPVAGALAPPLSAAPGSGPAAPDTSLQHSLDDTRERLERASVELAAARAESRVAGAEEGAEAARRERRLLLRKDRLMERERILVRLVADEDASLRQAERGERRAADAEIDGTTQAPAARDATPPAPSAAVVAPTAAPVPAAAARGGDMSAGIDAYLASKASPLTGLGAVFVAEAGRVGLDPRFIVAISGAETSFGTYGPAIEIRNPFGLGPHIRFPSWEAAIASAASNLAGGFYVGEGRFTIAAIQARWAPGGAANDPTDLNSHWTRNVSLYYAEQGGDPRAPVFSAEVTAGRPPAPVAGPTVGVIAPGAPIAPVVGNSETGPAAARAAAGLLGRPTTAARTDGVGPARLVRRVYRSAGLRVAGGAAALAVLGRPVRPSDLRAGDVLVFAAAGRPVATLGVYLGDGAFVHAPADAPDVALASLYEPRFTAAYAGARRY